MGIPPVEFRVVKKVARVHDPRRDFRLTEIESEVRFDPLTGDTARICHFAYPKREVPDLAATVEATRRNCPFCPDAVERVTPRYPAELVPSGRMRRGEALLMPNLFPYDDVSAVVAMAYAHFLPMRAMPVPVIADALKLARDFIALTAPSVKSDAAYGIVTWNYMPPSGASQVHPHLQVIVTDTPGNALARELAAEARFLSVHRHAFHDAISASERGGARWLGEAAGVAWWVPFCPVGVLGDAQGVFTSHATLIECSDAELEGFAGFLSVLLAAYAKLGLWSFNLTLFPDAFGETSGRHRLTARLLPRFYLHPQIHNSDASYLQLLLAEKFAMVSPESHAAELRAAMDAQRG